MSASQAKALRSLAEPIVAGLDCDLEDNESDGLPAPLDPGESITCAFTMSVEGKAGDEINELDGLKLKDTHGLVAAIAAYRPGDRIRLKFIRNSVEREVQVTLGKRKKPPTDIDAICY